MADERPGSGPLFERAESIREFTEMQLGSRVYFLDKKGNHWDGPRIADAFNLVAINVSGTNESAKVDVLFKWNGESETFGIRFPIRKTDPAIISEEDGHISTYVEGI
jgi:hypothetical protein